MFEDFLVNLLHNLAKPMLLFFYAGFLIPLLGVKFEFPKPIAQGLTVYLLLAIGWHGGVELAQLSSGHLWEALNFMWIGFLTNLAIGFLAYFLLRKATRLRQVDAATVAGFYGSDSAGTFVTAVGVLTATNIAFAPYMPVLLTVMEIPGCLVALFLVGRWRTQQAVAENLAAASGRAVEPGRSPSTDAPRPPATSPVNPTHRLLEQIDATVPSWKGRSPGRTTPGAVAHYSIKPAGPIAAADDSHAGGVAVLQAGPQLAAEPIELADLAALTQPATKPVVAAAPVRQAMFDAHMLHEIFLNPGVFMLLAGVAVGYFSRLQGAQTIAAADRLFNDLFPGLLCLFLLEMGITAASKLKDLRAAGPTFVAFGLLAPNLFAAIGLGVAHAYSHCLGHALDVGTYVLFAVLCGAASYIAMPALQKMAIPEASPTLPLAASLGVTFTYNVTIGIPVYLLAAQLLTTTFPAA